MPHPNAQTKLRPPLPLVVEPAEMLGFFQDDDVPLAGGDELGDVDILGGEDAELEEVEDGGVEGDAEVDLEGGAESGSELSQPLCVLARFCLPYLPFCLCCSFCS